MTWLGFVIHECRQLPARPFAGIAQIEVERPGARALERWYLVVTSGRTGFRVGRNATDLPRRLRQDAELLRQVRLRCLDEPVAVIEDLLAAGLGVRIEVLRIPGQRLCAPGHRTAALALRAQQRVHGR